MMKMFDVCLLLLLLLIMASCKDDDMDSMSMPDMENPDTMMVDPGPDSMEIVLFVDEFDSLSRGSRRINRISEPEPLGLGYSTDTPFGYALEKWRIVDNDAGNNRKSFWCIPERENGTIEHYAQQSGRSRNSIAFADSILPNDTSRYIIEFRQWCNDNDYIGFIIGATRRSLDHDGVEFGYERQLPGTDETVQDAYLVGDLGTLKLDNQALLRQWVDHRIEFKGKRISWYQDGNLMVTKDVEHFNSAGYFGIRQNFERGTRYDDVRIRIVDAR